MGHPDGINTAAAAPERAGQPVGFDDCLSSCPGTHDHAVESVFGMGVRTISLTASDAVSTASLKRASGQLPPEVPEKAAKTEKEQSWFDRTWVGQLWNWLWS